MKHAGKIILLQPHDYLQQEMPELTRTAFEIFYAQYLDQPDREMLYLAIGRIRPESPLHESFRLIEPLINYSVTDCHTAGGSLLMDAGLLPQKTPKAADYLSSEREYIKTLFSLCMRGLSSKLSGEEHRDAVCSAVLDFLFQISQQAYYRAAKDMYRRISA